MKQYTVARVSGAPDWAQIEAVSVDEHLWLAPVPIAMTAQLCYDEARLYVRLCAREANIRAEHDAPMSMVCEDSCMEFFFTPDPDNLRYFNFEINPNGRTYIGLCRSNPDHVRLAPLDEDVLLQKRMQRTPDGWQACYRIPLDFIRLFFPDFSLRSGAVLRGNFYKCGDLTVQPHYIAWNRVDSPRPDFHLPEYFGLLTLA